MEAPKLRFVRCPGCLQLLVEYPSIAVYQCGGCATVLRAKNRVAPTVNTNSESGEHNEFLNSSTGDVQSNKLICIDGQKISPFSNAQPGVVKEKIIFASEERNMSASNIIDSSEHVNIECSLVDGVANNTDKGSLSHSSLDSMKKVENVITDGNIDSEKSSFTDDGSISNEVATTRSMVHLDGAGSNSNLTGDVEILPEGKCALSDNNVNFQEIVASCRPDDETDSKSNNFSADTKDIFQPYEGLHESHEDLIEELVRSLSISDDEDDFLDIAENSDLNDALRSQMGSCRYSWGNKMNDAPRTDPHGLLIEELEMSFSDTEEPLDQNVMVAHNDILRSLSGASPFTICNCCFSLVQVPLDIYVSKRKIAKFQCGRCSKALVLSFPATHCEDTKLSKEEDQKPNKLVHNRVVGMEGVDSFSAECLRGDPVSISEECGASFSRSFSGITRPAVDASGSRKKVSDSALHRLMGYDSVSQLLAAHQNV